MAFDFPNAPANNQVFDAPGGPRYIFKSPTWQLDEAVGGVVLGPGVRTFDTRAQAAAADIDDDINHVTTVGLANVNDGLGGTYIRTNTTGNAEQFTDAGGTVWYRALNGYFRSWERMADKPLWKGARSFISSILIGNEAGGAAIPGGDPVTDNKHLIAIGHGALAGANTSTYSNIAIGDATLCNAAPGAHNLAIGGNALAYVGPAGNRNIGIGSLAGHFISSGAYNVLVGRDSGHAITTGYSNTAVGYRALSVGWQLVGFDGKIDNQYTSTGHDNVGIGESVLHFQVGNSNVGVGAYAGYWSKGNENTIVGTNAGYNLDKDLSENSKVVTHPNVAGTYVQSGTTITITATATGAVAGNKVGLIWLTGGNEVTKNNLFWTTVASVIDANHFTLTSTVSMTDSGTLTVQDVETAATGTLSTANVLIGHYTAHNSLGVSSSVMIGWDVGRDCTGNQNVLIGQRSGFTMTTAANNTGVGTNALRFKVDGTDNTAFNNCSALGGSTRTSGDNQIQLGDSSTTVYAYGAVQNRSDERDKADIQDTSLGLDFINGLRPVDYRWDMRDDYFEADAEGNLTPVTKDGSKKRNRLHHGFIAQEILVLTDQFGGVQDHKVNGGSDVLSLGYEELIAPLVKAVQQLTARVAELEAQLG